MRPNIQFDSDYEGRAAWRLEALAELAGTAAVAFRYCLAAQRDEKNGFPYTAAMEWQQAAGLVTFGPFADFCWRNWERIVGLPREMAEPFGGQVQQRNSYTLQMAVPTPAGNELLFLISA